MANLKALRARIASVKSTRKITQAMKMVAAAKLRRAQAQAEAARPYAERMGRMLASLGAAAASSPEAPKLLVGTGSDQTHLLVVVTGERGLAGAFNTNAARYARTRIRELEAKGKTVKVITVGRKGTAFLKREMGSRIVQEISYASVKRVGFDQAQEIADRITALLEAGEFDVCTLIYNRFRSVISQVPGEQQLIPTALPAANDNPAEAVGGALYEYEPGEEELLTALLPKNLAIQIYRAILESVAGFYGSQMNAMDNATRNAGEMINKLTLNYNRTRQANITSELIEIISGAEAL
ncbi:F0F1 ATP synthase subunit gamma [Roseomonas sp. OT10]|uniref:F0F1 ATP synthase subunit gamma n=1 Tax=Roseomonas cutis TaxID=2897332 RepID=UPI001E483AA4|nr:F0F1 ATP synthase subunit gamma [Roseomonas sp. OT10]UFN46978.1 F0F1 ATP synthase subunit gamma [Roseomonas sp. OT10]